MIYTLLWLATVGLMVTVYRMAKETEL